MRIFGQGFLLRAQGICMITGEIKNKIDRIWDAFEGEL